MRAAVAVALVLLAGCVQMTPAAEDHACPSTNRLAAAAGTPANHSVVQFSTSQGCMVAELYDDAVPITVANFLAYVHEGFYTDLEWHRIIQDYVIQSGGLGWDGDPKPATHPPIADEAMSAHLHNGKYTLAMARMPDPDYDSATSQFFVNMADNWGLDAGGGTEHGYCVFGKLLSGMPVADAIAATPATDDRPLLYSIEVLT